MVMNLEVLLTGSFGVGKSSIFNRFIHDDFSNKYYGTMGVRVNEKEISINDVTTTIKLWDIAGEIRQDKVPKPYFRNKTVILYVIDISRPFTFKNVPTDIEYLKESSPNSLVKIIGNKKDLLAEKQISRMVADKDPINFDWITSAKTGENIKELFDELVNELVSKQVD